MANCGFRIFKDGTNFGIAINVTDSTASSWSDFGSYNLYVNGSAALDDLLSFRNQSTNDEMGRIFCLNRGTVNSSHALVFFENSFTETGASTTYFETFSLPMADTNRSSNGAFGILTTKNAVTIAQGGTGATTAANARTQLGITPANIGAKATQTAVSDPAYNGDSSLTFIDTISQNTQGVITPHKAAVRHASATQNGIVTIGEQTFAGAKTFEDGLFIKSSDLYFQEDGKGSNAAQIFINNSTTTTTDHRLYFRQFSYNTDGTRTAYYDNYRLPAKTVASTANSAYTILTTKTMAEYSSSTIAYVTNSHLASVSSFYVYRMGRFGIFQAAGAALKAYGTSSWINVATIPEGYRPLVNVQQRMPGAGEWTCRIMTTGAVDIYKSSTSATTAYFSFPFPLAY